MILIDETKISKSLLCDIFLELGNEILEKGYTDEEKELLIAEIIETAAVDEIEEKFIKSAITQVEAATFLDYDRMIEEYLPLYQVKVGTYEGIDINNDKVIAELYVREKYQS